MKPCKAFHTENANGDHFLIAYDYNSGRRHRYTTFVWRVGRRARIIGRELTLGHSKKIVAAWPKAAMSKKTLKDELTEIVERIYNRGKKEGARRHK